MSRAAGIGAALALAWALAPGAAGAQPRELRPRNVITWQPLSLVTGYIDLEYERGLGRRASVYVAPGGIFSRTQHLDGSTSVGVYAASVDVGGRWFPLRDAPAGFFVDLGAGVYGSRFDAQYRVPGLGFRGVFQLGYTLMFGPLVFSTGVGVQVGWFTPRGGTPLGTDVFPALRVALGAAF